MKIVNRPAPTTLAPVDLIDTLARRAVAFSAETRAAVADEIDEPATSDPRGWWRDLIRQRTEGGYRAELRTAVARLAELASADAGGRVVRKAARNVVEAVEELAAFVPRYIEERTVMDPATVALLGWEDGEWVSTTYEVSGQSVAKLNAILQRVRVRLIELDALFTSYPTALARFADVARRVAEVILPADRARVVGGWFASLAAGADH